MLLKNVDFLEGFTMVSPSIGAFGAFKKRCFLEGFALNHGFLVLMHRFRHDPISTFNEISYVSGLEFFDVIS